MRLSDILQLNERREQADTLISAIKLGMSPGGQKFNGTEEFLTWVREIGGKEIGQGAYAVVYRGAEGKATDNHYVLKLSYGNDPWRDYANYCYQHPGISDENSLFPHVLFYTDTPTWASKGVAILEGLTVNQKRAEKLIGAPSIFGFKDTMKRVFKALVPPVGAGDPDDAKDAERICEQLGINPQDIISFHHKMVEIFGRTWLRAFDVHSNNIGWRANGQVVFFDPIS